MPTGSILTQQVRLHNPLVAIQKYKHADIPWWTPSSMPFLLLTGSTTFVVEGDLIIDADSHPGIEIEAIELGIARNRVIEITQ